MIKVGPAGIKGGRPAGMNGGRPSCNIKGLAVYANIPCSKLAQIFVSHDECIRGLQFQYEEDGILLLSKFFGVSTGESFSVVKLDYPYEYITSVSGSYDANNVRSLSFVTNNATYGPFGMTNEDCHHFKFETGQDDQFGGFHGSFWEGQSYSGITSIGVYIKPANVKSVAVVQD